MFSSHSRIAPEEGDASARPFYNDRKTSHLPRRASVYFPKIVTYSLSRASDGSVWCFPRETPRNSLGGQGVPIQSGLLRSPSQVVLADDVVAVKRAARQVAGYNEREVMIASGATLRQANELMVRLHELRVISKKQRD